MHRRNIMSIKRENGAGTVYKRTDGRWVAATWDPVTKKQKRAYASTKNKAEAKLRDMLNRKDVGLPELDTAELFRDFADKWLAGSARGRRSPATVNEYTSRLKMHAYPVLGNMRIDRITVKDIERMLDRAAANKLSRASLRSLRNAVAAMYSDARKERLLVSNPATYAQLPNIKPNPPKPIPTTEEINALIESIENLSSPEEQELGRIFMMLISTGARIGEVLAAQWADINTEEQVWTVKRTVTRGLDGRQTVGNRTKTGDDRAIKLAPALQQALQEQRKYVFKQRSSSGIWHDHDLIFPSSSGTVKDTRNLRTLLKRSFPEWKYGFHAIRHWFASLSMQAGVGDTQVARILGHRSTRTTRDTYGHLTAEGSTIIIDMVQRAIGNR
jgi:integrase